MDPRTATYIVFFIFVIPRFLTLAQAQVQDIKALISDIASPQRNLNPGLTPLIGSVPVLTIDVSSRKPDIPDTVIKITTFPSGKLEGYSPAMLTMIQGLLSRQEILLEYFPCDTMIYTVAVTRESVGVYSYRTDEEFWKKEKLFLRKIRLADFGDCRNQSETLSEVLLGTVSMKLKGKTRAVIIAHNALSGFPFEVLAYPVKRSGSPGVKTRYLIEGREIVYNNSAAQWLSSRIRSKISNGKANVDNSLAFVGFSPRFEFHECIQELISADHEVSTIGKMFRERGKTPVILLNENSNENNFKSIARFSHILHIATHTISSDVFPDMNGLLFNEYGSEQNNSGDPDDGLLAIHEICDLQITADLIVLNACASANIRSRIGMNWFSCADCFMKAGARNVLCTLWNVSDRLAEKFMVEFYRNYLAGMSFSKALQQVKVRMIADQSTSLPINWAVYVLMGE